MSFRNTQNILYKSLTTRTFGKGYWFRMGIELQNHSLILSLWAIRLGTPDAIPPSPCVYAALTPESMIVAPVRRIA
jgi:hypothetical protein